MNSFHAMQNFTYKVKTLSSNLFHGKYYTIASLYCNACEPTTTEESTAQKKKKKTELTDCAQTTAASAMDLSRLPFLLVDLDDVRTTS